MLAPTTFRLKVRYAQQVDHFWTGILQFHALWGHPRFTQAFPFPDMATQKQAKYFMATIRLMENLISEYLERLKVLPQPSEINGQVWASSSFEPWIRSMATRLWGYSTVLGLTYVESGWKGARLISSADLTQDGGRRGKQMTESLWGTLIVGQCRPWMSGT